jgi:hypothetical protein
MKAFKTIAAALLFFVSTYAYAQTTPFLSWAVADTNTYSGGAIPDGNGNFYSCLHNSPLNSFPRGSITKYNTQGGVLWRKSFSENTTTAYIAVDNEGNVIVAGYFRSTPDFDAGPGLAQLTTVNNTPAEDLYVCKYDANGNFMWVIGLGSDTYDYIHGLALDPSGNVYVGMSSKGNVDMDPGPGVALITNSYLTRQDIMVGKYDSNGNYLWSGSIGSTYVDELGGLTIKDNALYLTGSYTGTVDVDMKAGVNSITSNTATYGDNFIAKYDLDLNLKWVKNFGGAKSEGAEGISVRGNDLMICGWFNLTVDMDPGQGVYNLTSPENNISCRFIARYDTSGNFSWAKRVFISSYANLNGIAIDTLGHTILAGAFGDQLQIDGYGQSFTSTGNTDAFVISYNQSGGINWVSIITGGLSSSFEEINGLYIADDNTKILTGKHVGPTDVDLGNGTAIMSGTLKSFIAVYDLPGTMPQPYGAEMLTFSIPEQLAPAVIDSATQSITILVSNTANAAALTPTFTISPQASSSPPSGTTQDFGMTFTYVITSYDGQVVKEWDVDVIQESDTFMYDADILTFSIPQQVAPAIIDPWLLTVDIVVSPSTDLSQLTPTFTISPFATSNPLSGVTQDFTDPFGYTVTSFDGLVNNWAVNVTTGTGLNPETEKQIILYPNPTNGLLTISTGNLNGVGFQLCDITGRILFNQQLTNTSTQLDISRLAKGMYFCKFVSNGNVVGTKKVVVN